MTEFIAFISGIALVLITWYISETDDRRQYRIGYRDGYIDGIEGRRAKDESI